jgi:membrane associated rhomboid family serine protease
MSDDRGTWRALKGELKGQALILFGFLALLWAIEIVDTMLPIPLDMWGIRPRSVAGLPGILLAPLLHAGFGHLIANSGPLLVLGWFVMWRETHHWFVVTAFSTIIGGIGVWLIGASNSIHVGASIVCFGYLGYLLVRGWLDKRLLPILGSIVIAVAYGGLLFGLFPQRGLSWEGHLFGMIGGIVAAYVLARRAPSTLATR